MIRIDERVLPRLIHVQDNRTDLLLVEMQKEIVSIAILLVHLRFADLLLEEIFISGEIHQQAAHVIDVGAFQKLRLANAAGRPRGR